MRALSEVQCLCKQSARNDMILQCSSLNVIFELSSVQFKMVYIYISMRAQVSMRSVPSFVRFPGVASDLWLLYLCLKSASNPHVQFQYNI